MHKTHDCLDLKKYVFFIFTHEYCTGKYTTKIYRAVHQCDMHQNTRTPCCVSLLCFLLHKVLQNIALLAASDQVSSSSLVMGHFNILGLPGFNNIQLVPCFVSLFVSSRKNKQLLQCILFYSVHLM